MNEERAGGGPLDLFSGALIGTIIRLVGIAIVDAFAIWFILSLVDNEAWFLAVALVIVTIGLNVFFLNEKLYPFRWLSPGLALMIIMVMYPTLFTIYTAFTNYKTGNLLTRNQTIERIEEKPEYRYLPPGAKAYTWTVYQNEDGDYLLWLVEQGTAEQTTYTVQQDAGEVEPTTPEVRGTDGVTFDDDGMVTAIDGYEQLTTDEAAAALADIDELSYNHPFGSIRVAAIEDPTDGDESEGYVLDPARGIFIDYDREIRRSYSFNADLHGNPDVFNVTVFQAGDDEFALWMVSERGSRILVRPDKPVVIEDLPQTIDEFTMLSKRDRTPLITANRDTGVIPIAEVEFGSGETPIRVETSETARSFSQQYVYDEDSAAMVDQRTGAEYKPDQGTFTLIADSVKPGATSAISNPSTQAFRERYVFQDDEFVDQQTGGVYGVAGGNYLLDETSLSANSEDQANTPDSQAFRERYFYTPSGILDTETEITHQPETTGEYGVPDPLDQDNELLIRQEILPAAVDVTELDTTRYELNEYDAIIDRSAETTYPLEDGAFNLPDLSIPANLDIPATVEPDDERYQVDAESGLVIDQLTGAIYTTTEDGPYTLDPTSLAADADDLAATADSGTFRERYGYSDDDEVIIDQMTGAIYGPGADAFELDLASLTSGAEDLASTEESTAFREQYAYRYSAIIDQYTGALYYRYDPESDVFELDQTSLGADVEDPADTELSQAWRERYVYEVLAGGLLDLKTGAIYRDGKLDETSLAYGSRDVADNEASRAFRERYFYTPAGLVDRTDYTVYSKERNVEKTLEYTVPDPTSDEEDAVLVVQDFLIREELSPGYFVVIGLENFDQLLTDEGLRGPFLRVFLWTISHAFLAVFTTFTLGLALAILMNVDEMPFRKLLRSLILIPYAIPAFISTLVWRGLLNPRLGLINEWLEVFVGEGNAPAWYSSPNWAKVGILLIQLWLGFPYMMLICTGALQGIPRDMYEAAEVDGASPWQRFRHLTLPLLLVAVGPLLIASFAFNFNNFTVIELFNEGGPPIPNSSVPAGHTDILITYTYQQAFGTGGGTNYALASAISIFIFVIVATITIFNFRFTRAWEEVSENV